MCDNYLRLPQVHKVWKNIQKNFLGEPSTVLSRADENMGPVSVVVAIALENLDKTASEPGHAHFASRPRFCPWGVRQRFFDLHRDQTICLHFAGTPLNSTLSKD